METIDENKHIRDALRGTSDDPDSIDEMLRECRDLAREGDEVIRGRLFPPPEPRPGP